MNSFDQLYYINLEYRKDMYDSINNVIDNLGFDRSKVTRIEGIKKDNGAYGVALSQIKALQDAKSKGYEKILIFEDDFVPFNYEETNNKVSKFLNEFKDWDVIMLSTNPDAILIYTGYENIYKVVDSQCAMAYAVHKNFIDKLLEVYIESANELSKIETYSDPCEHCIDVKWKKIQQDSLWYAFRPILGKEYPKWSDVQNRYVRHWVN